MFRRLLMVLLTICFLFCAFSFVMIANGESIVTGKCGDNLTYTLYGDGLLIISGKGKMYDWETYESPWCFSSSINTVIINSGVKSIGAAAFQFCDNLQEVYIPNTVTNIGGVSFNGCALKSVTIPNSVTNIGEGAFGACANLTSINVDENNTKYSSVGGVLFNKDKTTLITYPGGNTALAYEIPETVKKIDVGAFSGCECLMSVFLPDSVTEIGDSAFFFCTGLKTINIPSGVEAIKEFVFLWCSNLGKITFEGRSTDISQGAFNCENLTIYAYIGSSAHNYAQSNNISFVPLDEAKYIVQYDLNGGSGSIPNGNKIEDYPFYVTSVIPTKVNCGFLGWSTTPDGIVEYKPGAEYLKNKDITLYAVWESAIPMLKIKDIICRKGDTVTVNIDLAYNPGICGIMIDIYYPDSLTLLSTQRGNALKELDSSFGAGNANPKRVLFVGIDSDYSNGTLVILTFKANDTTEDVSGYIEARVESCYDGNFDDIDLGDVSAKITIVSSIPGDINGDTLVDLKDVTTLRRHLAGGYDVTVQNDALDVNGDGTVDLKDVTYLRRALAGGYGIELK